MSFSDRLVASWYTRRITGFAAALAPLALGFQAIVALRTMLYRAGALRSERLPVPVVIVGNIVAGGSGKTPLTIAISNELRSRGWHPGIVSRGYGGTTAAARAVRTDASPRDVGDEALLLARSGHPVWVGHDRPSAARGLLAEHAECDVIVADDGLQHYALARDVEIVVIDSGRGFGNGLMLPAGPLREPLSRLDDADAIVTLDGAATERRRGFAMSIVGNRFMRVNAPAIAAGPEAFRSGCVHALAGIGNPQRFFDHLAKLGIAATPHAFPDHHRFVAKELALPGATAILMTEKDAVKCCGFADDRCWVLPVRAETDPALLGLVEEKLRGSQTARNSGLSGHQRSTHL